MITSNIDTVVKLLKKNKIVSIPTDTIFGISCLPTLENTRKLQKLKGSSKNKRFILITDCFSRVSHLCTSINSHDRKMILESKNTTWLIKSNTNAKDLSIKGNIAIRVSNHPVIKQICSRLDSSLLSTSVNIHKNSAITSFNEIIKSNIMEKIECLFQEKNVLQKPTNKASKIINLTTKQIIR
jgi:L-threonylcarbamoyladenylate synthase